MLPTGLTSCLIPLPAPGGGASSLGRGGGVGGQPLDKGAEESCPAQPTRERGLPPSPLWDHSFSLLEMSETSPFLCSCWPSGKARSTRLEAHRALPCRLPATLPSCRRSYKKHSHLTIGDITQRRKELDSARCQGELWPLPLPQDMSPLGKGLGMCHRNPGGMGSDSQGSPRTLGEGQGMGHGFPWRGFQGWGLWQRSWGAGRACWLPSVSKQRAVEGWGWAGTWRPGPDPLQQLPSSSQPP